MKVHLQYGTSGVDVEVPSDNVQIMEPVFLPGLADEAAGFVQAVRGPIESAPLRDLIGGNETVAVVIPDGTRPLPSDRLLTWLFAELGHVAAKNIVIVNGTGSHRANTRDELVSMVGEPIVNNYRIENHNAHDASTHARAGVTADGRTIRMNRAYVEADRRIVLGFIEPHFMAGFSGGYKGVFPAVADIDSILHYHRAAVIGDARSTWGLLEGNPTQDQIRANASLLPVDFLVNVTLNRKRQITRYFCGAPMAAHTLGCAFVKDKVMIPCPKAFPIVVTSNSGFPLDQNLYQTVKGMSAAAQIVAPGGLILAAARCNDGFPEHGNFKKMLFEHDSARSLLATIERPGYSMFDQWQAQLLALIALKARVGVYSEIDPADIRRAHMEPVADMGKRLAAELLAIGKDAPIAVLPEGPMTIPYLKEAA